MRPEVRVRLLYFLGFFTIVVILIVVVAVFFGVGNTLTGREGRPLTAGERYVSDEFEPAFSFVAVGEGWKTEAAGEDLELHAEMRDHLGIGRGSSYLGFLTVEEVFDPSEPSEADRVPAPKDIVAWFQQHPYLETEEPELTSIGGVKGVYFDVVPALTDLPEDYDDSACAETDEAALSLISLRLATVCLYEGEKVRIIVLEDVEGETVTIIFGGAAVNFEEFLPKVQKVLDTVEWEDA
jgi:hypothetical protein